jgi:hypothetical protein
MYDEVYYQEAEIYELDWNYANFDNLPAACMSILQIMTLEGWNKMMYNYYDSWNPVFTSLYFSAVVLAGTFFVLNILLAAIHSSFTKVRDAEEEKLLASGESSVLMKKAL